MKEIMEIPFEKLQKKGLIAIWSPIERIYEVKAVLRRRGYQILKEVNWIKINDWDVYYLKMETIS